MKKLLYGGSAGQTARRLRRIILGAGLLGTALMLFGTLLALKSKEKRR